MSPPSPCNQTSQSPSSENELLNLHSYGYPSLDLPPSSTITDVPLPPHLLEQIALFPADSPERLFIDRLSGYHRDRACRREQIDRQEERIKLLLAEYYRRLHGTDGIQAWDDTDQRMVLLRTKIDTLRILRRLNFMTEMIFGRLDSLEIGIDLFAKDEPEATIRDGEEGREEGG
ncbi:hypothetical protein TWF694_007329 [Orbilia ellipsospora]|uniref:Uncharacterized protein n=1 Tax=Orbilia ellipsospora TaxID=2528407 RepID=A0AAV9XKU6_9PEZI